MSRMISFALSSAVESISQAFSFFLVLWRDVTLPVEHALYSNYINKTCMSFLDEYHFLFRY